MGRGFLGQIALLCCLVASPAWANETMPVWNLDDIQPGMKGTGVTVLKGTKLENFDVEILGVLRKFSPGRDMVLARVSGLGLEKTGVIAGMSGSPVYIDGKMVGAVAFTWDFMKEPIAGITPFSQMKGYADGNRHRNAGAVHLSSYLLDDPKLLANTFAPMEAVAAPMLGGRMIPIQTPVAISGFSNVGLESAAGQLSPFGMVPMQAGGMAAAAPNQNVKIVPGGAMGVGLVTGDVSISAIGTVTDVLGERVFGFGHPFFGLGECELPLQTASILTVLPRQSISTKMGSPISTVGKVDADVSTCVAGWMGKEADMMPLVVELKSNLSNSSQKYQCEMVREPTLMGVLALTVLSGCATVEGQAPQDLTTQMVTKVEIEGYPPLVIRDTYSGDKYSGTRGLQRIYAPIGNLLTILANNPFDRPRIKSVTCSTELSAGRISAEVVNAQATKTELKPGETLKVIVTLQPYRPHGVAPGELSTETVEISLPIPKNLKPGSYRAKVGEAPADLQSELSNRKHLRSPTNFKQLYDLLALQLAINRTDVVLRLDEPGMGVAIEGVEFPDMPTSMIDIFSQDHSRPMSTLRSSAVERVPTKWVIEGTQRVSFKVVEEKEFYE